MAKQAIVRVFNTIIVSYTHLFFQKRIKGRGYCDVGTSVISEIYTPLVPKGHDFLQTIGRLAQERQAMPEQQGKEDVIE